MSAIYLIQKIPVFFFKRSYQTINGFSSVVAPKHQRCHSLMDSNVKVLPRKDRWLESEVKCAIFVRLQQSFLNKGGSEKHNLSSYNTVLSTVHKKVNIHSHPGCWDFSEPNLFTFLTSPYQSHQFLIPLITVIM